VQFWYVQPSELHRSHACYIDLVYLIPYKGLSIGTYADLPAATGCKVCSSGKVSNSARIGCLDITCNPGFYVTNGQCSACQAGTYQSNGNSRSTSCQVCSVAKYSTTGQSFCQTCASGKYAARTGASTCQAWAVCSSDSYERFAGTAESDRVCAPVASCSAGSYQSAAPTPTSNRVCQPIRACSVSEYETGAPTVGILVALLGAISFTLMCL
jgi:hypothetical protein